MKKILLVCSAGMSTSLLVSKMEKVAQEQGLEVTIAALSVSAIQEEVGNWDVCLVGPQIKYALDQVKETLNIPTEVIDMRVYGMANGQAALEQALGMMK